jgi:hypothetical protein
MSLFDNLPHVITIYKPTVTQDTSAGEVVTYDTVRTANVPCLICAGAGGERDEFYQSERPVSTHTIAFGDSDGDVQPGDQLVDDNTGQKYRFTGDRPQQGVGGIDGWNQITVREVN